MGLDELTPREREVAAVAATGASTRAIAEQLFVSRRTVETHLGAVYRKLDVTSRPELVALLLRAGVTPADTAPSRVPVACPALPVPAAFVGRVDELAVFRSACQRAAADGRRAVVLVGGEAGVGKSSLVGRAAQEAAARDVVVLAGRCDDALASPYGAIADALTPFLRALPDPLDASTGPLGGALAGIVPDLEDRLPPLSDRVDPAERPRLVADAVVHVLAHAASAQPVMLVIEDLQWGDRATVALVRRLIGSRETGALCVVATFRDTDLARAHPLPGLLADLWRVDDVVRIQLRGLEPDDALALAEQIAPGVEPDVVRRLARDCAGNPFFLTQLLPHAAAATAGDMPTSVPQALRDVVLEDVRRLDESMLAPLQLAAVAGHEFDLVVLEAAAGRTGSARFAALLDHLERACDAGLLRESAEVPGRFAFGHDLTRQALLSTLGPTRLARLHQAIGSAMLAAAADDVSLFAPVAMHLQRSLDPADRVTAGRLVLRTLQDPRSRISPDDAAEHARRAIDALPEGRAADGVRLEVLLALADVEVARLDSSSHRRAVLDAIEVARRLDGPEEVARVLTAFRLLPRMGTVDEAMLALTKDAVAALGPEPSTLRARLVGYSAYQRSLGGEGFRVVGAAAAAVDEARATGELATLADTLFDLAGTLLGSPDVDRQLAVGNELVRVGRRLPGALGPADGRRFLGVAHLCAGSRAAFEADLAALTGDAEQTRNKVLAAMAASWRALLDLGDGALERAEVEAGRALAEAGDDPNFQLGWFAQLCMIRAEQGRAAEMVALARQVATEHGDVPAVHAMHAWLLHADGRPEDARAALTPLRALGGPAALPHDWLLPGTLGLLAPVLASIGTEDECAALLDALAPYRGQVLVLGSGTVMTGAADRFAGLLEARVGDVSAARVALTRARDLEQQLGARLLVAHTMIDGAAVSRHADAIWALDDVAVSARDRDWAWVARRVERIREAAG